MLRVRHPSLGHGTKSGLQRVNRPDYLEAVPPRRAAAGIEVVYAIRTGNGLIKIGHTVNLVERFQHMAKRDGAREILGFRLGTYADEQDLHARLRSHLHHGREWYYPVPEVMAVVAEMREALGLPAL